MHFLGRYLSKVADAVIEARFCAAFAWLQSMILAIHTTVNLPAITPATPGLTPGLRSMHTGATMRAGLSMVAYRSAQGGI